MLDTHLCFISPSLFFLIGHCSRRWSPGAGVPRRRLLRRRVPRRPGVAWSSQAGGFAFSICISDVVCASLLKAKLDQLCLYSDIMVCITLYSGPRDPPLSCIILVYPFVFSVVL